MASRNRDGKGVNVADGAGLHCCWSDTIRWGEYIHGPMAGSPKIVYNISGHDTARLAQ